MGRKGRGYTTGRTVGPTVGPTPPGPSKTIEDGHLSIEDNICDCLANFELPEINTSTEMDIQIISNTYDNVIRLEWSDDVDKLYSDSSDLPDDLGPVEATFVNSNGNIHLTFDGSAESEYTIKVLSIESDGQTIYP